MKKRRKSIPPRDTTPFLRSSGGREGWIVNRFSRCTDFRERWNAAVSYSDSLTRASILDVYWERQEAVSELWRKFPGFAYPGPWFATPSPDLVECLWKESSAYAAHLNQVVQINEGFRRATKALLDAEKIVRGAGHNTILQRLFSEYVGALSELRTNLGKASAQYWNDGYLKPDLLPPNSTKIHRTIFQDRNLDTIFQIRAAELLRSSMPSLSLLTIARLVVLSYICADIAEEKDNELIVLGSDPARRLRVNGTYEKLRDAGLREP